LVSFLEIAPTGKLQPIRSWETALEARLNLKA
jgi:hypothetical protein